MNRERRVRLYTVSVLCVAATVSVFLLRAGRAERLLRAMQAVYVYPNEPLCAFGPFHIAALALCIAAAMTAGVLAWRYGSEAVTDRVVFVCGIVFFLLEWYKQLSATYVQGNGIYDLSVLPFQFCSLPLEVCLTAPMLGPRAKHTLYCFLALFGTVGGYLVMGFPNLPDTLTMSVHTMIWHSMMIALGVWLLVAEPCGKSFKRDYLPSAAVFLSCFGLAMLLNILLHDVAERQGTALNLYYMSPYYETHFLIVRDARELWGWGASVAVYLLLFLFVGALPLFCLGAFFGWVREKNGKN